MNVLEIIAIELLELYIIYKFMHIFFGEARIEKRAELLLYVLKSAIGIFVTYKIGYPLVNFVTTFITTFIITYSYDATFSKRVSSALIINIGKFVAEAITALIIGLTGFSVWEESKTLDFSMMLLCEIIYWFIYLVIRRFKHIRNDMNVPKLFFAAIIMVQLLSVVLSYVIFKQDRRDAVVDNITFMLVLATNYVIIYLYDSLSRLFSEEVENQLLQSEKKYYYNEAKLLQHNYMELRRFKHDTINRLCAIAQMLEQKSYTEAKDYTDKLIGNLNNSAVYSQTGVIAVDSIINYKLSDAATYGIEIASDTLLPMDLEIDADDIIVIISNLLDNAIEAAKVVEDRKYISVYVNYKKGCVLIKIENSYVTDVMEKDGKLLTHKEDKKSHGIGMGNVDAVVKKYDGQKKMVYDGKNFSVYILLPVATDNL